MSTVVAIGATHRSAPLALLERLTLDEALLDKYLDDLVARDHVTEAVIVSTCNRIEIFVTAEKFHGAYRDVRDFISDVTFLLPEQFSDHLEVRHDADAVHHLFAVAAGLESVVVGGSCNLILRTVHPFTTEGPLWAPLRVEGGAQSSLVLTNQVGAFWLNPLSPEVLSGVPTATIRPSRIPMSPLTIPQWSMISALVITQSAASWWPGPLTTWLWPMPSRMVLPPPNLTSSP